MRSSTYFADYVAWCRAHRPPSRYEKLRQALVFFFSGIFHGGKVAKPAGAKQSPEVVP